MTGGDDRPLDDVLSLLAPRRVILVGPDGLALGAAIGWARRHASIRLRRSADAADASDGDLLVAQEARLLPERPAASLSAIVPAAEVALAELRGWRVTIHCDGDVTLLHSDDPASAELEMRIESYARSRLVISRELAGLSDGRAGLLATRDHLQPRDPGAAEPAALAYAGRPPVTVVVPIYNAAPELRRCLHALAANTTWPCELLLIDDASPDPEVGEILAEAARMTGVRVLRNAVNLGFTATVNRGLRASFGDVVLLNSDTEVGPRWLEHLVQAAASAPEVATVTAISDNAGAFSVPLVGEANRTPLGLDRDSLARRLAQAAEGYPRAPTGNGFCMYITRRVLDAIGVFDAEGFPRGYGEENDFCMRAVRAGWAHLVDPHTFVRHVRGSSFGIEKSQLVRTARARVDERYPEYTDLVREFVSSEGMQKLRGRVQEAYAAPAPRPRVLSIIHEGAGGTWIGNLDLIRSLEREWDPLVLSSDRRTLRLWQMDDGHLAQLWEHTLERSIRATDFSREDYVALVRSVLEEHEVELVHVRHLFKHTFDVPRLAAKLGIPVVFSFHDYYFTCPTVNLLDNRDTYCAGQCTEGDGDCRVPPGLTGVPHLKHSYVYQWREEVEAMLSDVDAFVTTSAHARDVHLRALPSLAGRPFELIEHGRALRQRSGIAAPPPPAGPIKILVVANLDVHKGADYIRELRAADTEGRLEFHFLGSLPSKYADLGTAHGSFEPDELPERAATVAPAFGGLFSIVGETYSHSLTEAWALGMPVIATDIGALGERVRAHGGGQLIPLGDAAESVRRIYHAAQPDQYERLREQASLHGCATVTDMSDAYALLYRRALERRRPLVATGVGAPARLRGGVLSLLAVVPGAQGVHPGSTYVRVIQRYRHPAVSGKLSMSVRRADQEPLSRESDLVLVQRTALDPAAVQDFIAALRNRGTPLILDLDDHLLIKGSDDPDYGRHQEALAGLIDSARLVLVSNEKLAEAIAGGARQVAVVPNLIDERLFLSGVDERPRSMTHAGQPLQLVYVGSPTHARDLEILRPVMSELHARYPGAFELNVVGVEPLGEDQEWYRRVSVPDAAKPYPRFVTWLRGQRPSWHVGLAPLLDDEFNRYKSDLKYLEYAALGLPAVFSDREPYRTVEHERTGLKLGDDVEQWVQALVALRESDAMREQLADLAFAEVTAQRLLCHGTEQLLEIFFGLAVEEPVAGPPQRVADPVASL